MSLNKDVAFDYINMLNGFIITYNSISSITILHKLSKKYTQQVLRRLLKHAKPLKHLGVTDVEAMYKAKANIRTSCWGNTIIITLAKPCKPSKFVNTITAAPKT